MTALSEQLRLLIISRGVVAAGLSYRSSGMRANRSPKGKVFSKVFPPTEGANAKFRKSLHALCIFLITSRRISRITSVETREGQNNENLIEKEF